MNLPQTPLDLMPVKSEPSRCQKPVMFLVLVYYLVSYLVSVFPGGSLYPQQGPPLGPLSISVFSDGVAVSFEEDFKERVLCLWKPRGMVPQSTSQSWVPASVSLLS